MSSSPTATLTGFAAVRTGDAVTLSAQLEHDRTTREIYFRVAGEPNTALLPSPEPFIVGLLWPLMRQGVSLSVDAEVDADLLYQLSHEVIPLLRSTEPELSPVEISAAGSTESSPSNRVSGAVTGMSCGIDSFASLRGSKEADCPPSRRIERFLFHDVGSHGPKNSRKVYLERLGRARSVARAERIPLIEIGSNLGDFYSERFERTHTLRNAAAAFNMRPVARSYLYSSTYGFSGVHCGPTKDMATADPILLPQLSTSTFRLLSAGSAESRIAKTVAYIADPIHVEHLDICVRPFASAKTNCGTCPKCGRFLLVAEADGALDRFATCFDVDAYRKAREVVVDQMVAKASGRLGNANDRDHVEYLRSRGANLPSATRASRFVRQVRRAQSLDAVSAGIRRRVRR